MRQPESRVQPARTTPRSEGNETEPVLPTPRQSTQTASCQPLTVQQTILVLHYRTSYIVPCCLLFTRFRTLSASGIRDFDATSRCLITANSLQEVLFSEGGKE